MSRKTKRIIQVVLFVLLIGASYYASIQPEVSQQVQHVAPPAGTYRVISTEDGDTITVDMDGTKERVRFIGVDTPETQDPRKPVQCFGKAASEYTRNLIGQNPVKLEADPTNTNRDRYNRLLRYIYLPDGTLVNAKIIEDGYGFAYTSFPFIKLEEFRALQKEAREQNRGLWSSCTPMKNKYGGYTSNNEERLTPPN